MSSTEDMVRRSLRAQADLTTYQPTSALDVARRARAARRRRTATVAMVAAAALVTLGVPAGLMLSQGGPDDTGTPTDTPTTNSPDPTPDPALTPPKLISYDGDGSDPVEVRSSADASKLAGAPDSFKEFIGRTAERLTQNTTCEPRPSGVSVRALRTDGYAVGAVNECGGYVALWAIVDGDWKEIADTLDLWDCAVLVTHRVPSDIAGDSCYDADARAQRPYRQS